MRTFAARVLSLVLLASAGCASVPTTDTALSRPAPPAAVRFGVDTFAFPNESRAKNPGKPDLYANYCFVMARAVTQFMRFARFEPGGARLTADEYAARVKQVVARPPWDEPLAPADRVVIPGFSSLYELSREEERAVKEGLGGRLWTLIHWTNWRVAIPLPLVHWRQERVAREALLELQAGRAVQLLVTNLPTIELNHTVVAYGYRVGEEGVLEFIVYDPNDPYVPGIISFDRAGRRFVATRLFDTRTEPIRAFRMYYSPLL